MIFGLRPAADSAELTPAAKGPSSNTRYLASGLDLSADTSVLGALPATRSGIVMLAIVILQSGHSDFTCDWNVLVNPSRIGYAGTCSTTALPLPPESDTK